ncbi:hypothetical protein CRG98_004232, partial [Punica granatum]
MAAAASMVASPLCTWLVAACMSTSFQKDPHAISPTSASSLSPSKRLSRRLRRRILSQCCGASGGSSNNCFSSICGSSFQGLVSSYLGCLEPCNEYYSSKGSASLGFFGENGFTSLFGSRPVRTNRRQRRLNRAARS